MSELAYVISRFPLLMETFILREILELERQGWDLDVFAIQRQRAAVRHPEASQIEAQIAYFGLASMDIARANARLLSQAPARYVGLFATALLGNRTSPEFAAKALALFPATMAITRQMRARGVRHIHAHYGSHPALAALLAADVLGASYSFTVHAHDLFVDTAMLTEKVRRARFVVAISDYNRRRLIELAGSQTAQKIHVVRCGVDTRLYQYRAWEPGQRLKIVTVASLQEYKGHAYLIRACGLLRAAAPDLDFSCDMVGEGKMRPRLEALIRELHLEDRVHLLGEKDQHTARKLMAEADLMVLPSIVARSGQMEGIPLALMEAMALGRPVVASDLSGIPELVRPGETGLLTPPANPAALRDAVLACWRDPDATQARARAARTLVEQEYDLQRNAALLGDHFGRVLGRPGSQTRQPVSTAG